MGWPKGKKRPDLSEQNRNRTGDKHPMFGKKRPEHSKRMKGDKNPMFGKHRSGDKNPNYKHGYGYRHNKIYFVWNSMKQRCLNPNSQVYALYGGRGISVCKEWTDRKHGFENFLEI